MAEPTLKIEDAQQIIDWLSIGDFKNIDEFKSNFQKKYLTSDDVLKSKPVKDFIGKIQGTENTELKKVFKTMGIDISDNEVEEDDGNGGKVIRPRKVAAYGVSKMQESNNKIQEELKKQIGATNDETIKKLQEDYNKLKLDHDSKDKIILDAKTEKERLEKEKEDAIKLSDGKIKEYVKMDKVNKLRDSFPWAEEANDYVKEGFWANINKKAKFELDEKDNLVVRNAESGELFPSPSKNGVFLTPDEFLKAEGIEANKKAPVFKINESGGAKQGEGSFWNRNKNPKPVDPQNKPKLAVNISKTLPSTAKAG